MPKPKPIPFDLTEQETANFWRNVDKSPGQGPDGDCWEWIKYRKPNRNAAKPWGNYGVHTIQRRGKHTSFSTHRLAYHLGVANPNDKYVCHRCDNPPCCNPSHLFLDTLQGNLKDRDNKGRTFRGKRINIEKFIRGQFHPSSKLTDAQVEEIRQSGMTATELYRTGRYSVSRRAIAYALKNQTWKGYQSSHAG